MRSQFTCCVRFLALVIPLFGFAVEASAAARSHPALRTEPAASKRPLGEGPQFFVDGNKGRDANNGSRQSPWRSIGHAVKQLRPGDTLCLRQGTYYENVYLAGRGTPDKPIVIRGYPGERAVIDGGLREFFETPAAAWMSHDVAGGEFRSKGTYRNLRNVVGSFGDSMIGLNTYYHSQDLRAKDERPIPGDPARPREVDIKPIYCGPGLWYDATTGHIHTRLSHTHLPGLPNYRGQTDPRKLPLVISHLRSVPLWIDGARHVKLHDLVIRGGGYDCVKVDYSRNVEFDNVTIWCATYGMRCAGSGPLRFVRSAIHGNCPPWLTRGDTSKRAYPGRPQRDITRLNTHAVWVIDAGREFSVYAHPMNDDWEIAWSEFTDAHDGLYLGGINLRFHHNLIEGVQDDGLYLSQMYPRHLYMRGGATLRIDQNVFRGCLTALAFGGTEDTRDRIFVCRNLFDLRTPVFTSRPRPPRNAPGISYGRVMGDHGSPPWPEMNVYHNTFVMRGPARQAAMQTLGHVSEGHPRRVYNNLFAHLARLPGFNVRPGKGEVRFDGNLYWSPGTTETQAASYFDRYRRTAKELAAAGHAGHSRVADPQFAAFDPETKFIVDIRLRSTSAAINAGIALPADWPDPLQSADSGTPDIGALPIGAKPFAVGRRASAAKSPR